MYIPEENMNAWRTYNLEVLGHKEWKHAADVQWAQSLAAHEAHQVQIDEIHRRQRED